MTHWYSPSMSNGSGGFGLTSWGKKKRPADAVNVSAEEHAALFPQGEPQREIEAGPDGKPGHKVASVEAQRTAAIADVKREAARRIEAIMPMYKQINALRADIDLESFEGFRMIDHIRTASNIIELDLIESEAPGFVPIADHPAWPNEGQKEGEQG